MVKRERKACATSRFGLKTQFWLLKMTLEQIGVPAVEMPDFERFSQVSKTATYQPNTVRPYPVGTYR